MCKSSQVTMFGIYSSLRFKTSDSKKKDLGILFKKMNMDTKQLFGDLLETNNKTRKKNRKLKVDSRDDGGKNQNNHLKQLLKSNIKPVPKSNTLILS